MNYYEKNIRIIAKIKNGSEEFEDLEVKDNSLLYKGLVIDLKMVDLEQIIRNMSEITPDNFFNALSNINTNKDNIAKWEIVKNENPHMKNITIFNNHNLYLNKQEEFINIRTSDGKNHLFKNVIGLDIFNEYMKLKAIYGDNISPDLLATSIEKWQLNELKVEPAEKIIENPEVNENIKNQLQEYINKYKSNKNIEITANVDEDIIYINNKENPDKNYIVTFTKDINNELVAVEHNSNVSSETITKEEVNQESNPERQEETPYESQEVNNISESTRGSSNTEYQNTQTILSDNDFAFIVARGNYSAADYEKINKYLDNVQDMISHDNPNIETKLKVIEESITNLQLLKDNLNSEEQVLIERCNTICDEINKSKGLDKGQVLTYKNDNRVIPEEEEDNTSGYLNVISIFITVSVVLIGLSILVLYFINS